MLLKYHMELWLKNIFYKLKLKKWGHTNLYVIVLKKFNLCPIFTQSFKTWQKHKNESSRQAWKLQMKPLEFNDL